MVFGLALFILGFLWYALLGMQADYYTMEGLQREEPDMIYLILGHLVYGLAGAWIYDRWAGGVHSAVGGATFGALIAIFVSLGLGLIIYATTNITTLSAVLLDVIVSIVIFGIAGAVMAMVFKARS